MLDPRIKDSLTEMRAGWTLDDIGFGHDYLDQLDVIGARNAARAGRTGQHV